MAQVPGNELTTARRRIAAVANHLLPLGSSSGSTLGLCNASMNDSYHRVHGEVSDREVVWRAARDETGKDFTDIIYEKAVGEGIAKISINRPERRNAFAPHTVKELMRAFNDARDDSSIGVIILTAKGTKAFCSGGDQALRTSDGYADQKNFGRLNVLDLHVQIRRLPKPVIAMVAGYAVGGGHVLHMVCDLTIAADNAIFGQTGPKVGSFDAGYGSSIMSRLIGPKKAREMWFLARFYTASEAEKMGLVNAVVPLDKLEKETVKWCREILRNSPTAIRVLKSALNAVDDGHAGLQVQIRRLPKPVIAMKAINLLHQPVGVNTLEAEGNPKPLYSRDIRKLLQHLPISKLKDPRSGDHEQLSNFIATLCLGAIVKKGGPVRLGKSSRGPLNACIYVLNPEKPVELCSLASESNISHASSGPGLGGNVDVRIDMPSEPSSGGSHGHPPPATEGLHLHNGNELHTRTSGDGDGDHRSFLKVADSQLINARAVNEDVGSWIAILCAVVTIISIDGNSLLHNGKALRIAAGLLNIIGFFLNLLLLECGRPRDDCLPEDIKKIMKWTRQVVVSFAFVGASCLVFPDQYIWLAAGFFWLITAVLLFSKPLAG